MEGSHRPAFTSRSKCIEAAREREQHADGVIRHFFEAVVGNVGDPDAAASCFIYRDVVEADAEAPDDAQVRARGHGLRGHLRPVRENAGRLMLLDQCLDFSRGRRVSWAGNEAISRSLDDLALDLEIGPGVVRDDDSGAVSGCGHSIRLLGMLMQGLPAS